ncbi:hypothetical protein PMG11_08732 [Penicillium brasilianum]|uniref:Uncharacterized protein n=1 Tax=Penicillium brasilianum TaxID=104259 RepID=A0A0F7TYN0_PENBI|nr:hypothetical protein PMG11_08732 [Penicillium brasilianum]
MERKLSQKALRMRQRFNFSRGRDRAATMPPSGATGAPSSRPRSATTPISSRTTSNSSTDRTRYFHFEDEPGYFRPASPLIHRQSVSEDLEDDVKHACALLVQSVDRGFPIWPSGQGEHRPNTTTAPKESKSSQTTSRFYYQGASMSPSAVDNQIKLPSDQMHDSGVAFQHSAASAGAGRFYGSQISTSRHEETDLDIRGRSRSRGQSFNTDATPASRSRSRSRSRSFSPDMFPYSPPQVDTLWPHVKDIYFESSDALFCETETETETETEKEIDVNAHPRTGTLGAERLTWRRTSLDIPCLKTPARINVNVTAMPTAAPRRFYSTRQPRAKGDAYPTAIAGWDLPHSRTPSVDDASLRRFSSAEDGHDDGVGVRVPHRAFDQVRRSVSSCGLQGVDQRRLDPGYAIESGGQSRRRKASHLLKKLTGLRRRKDGEGGFEGRRVAITA